jgi:hypothetical protein
MMDAGMNAMQAMQDAIGGLLEEDSEGLIDNKLQ